MSVLTQIEAFADDLTAIRRDIHAHPEIGFEEVRTSALVARELKAYGVDEIHTGIGKTGVVGIIRGKRDGARKVGLRADRDGLPRAATTNSGFPPRVVVRSTSMWETRICRPDCATLSSQSMGPPIGPVAISRSLSCSALRSSPTGKTCT